MNGTSNGKMSLAIAGGIGILGALVGTAVTSLLIVPALKNVQKGTTKNAPTHWKAVITFNTTDKSCTQFASRDNFGNAVKYSFPVLSQGGGDTIMWRGRIDAGRPNLRVHVEFPDQTSSPFTDYRYDGNIDTGPAT